MSMSVKVSRARTQGDPSLLGDIAGGLLGAATGLLTGGPGGAIAGGLAGAGLLGGKGSKPRQRPAIPGITGPAVFPRPPTFTKPSGGIKRLVQQPVNGGRVQPGAGKRFKARIDFPIVGGGAEIGFGGVPTARPSVKKFREEQARQGMGLAPGTKVACPPGYRPNKSSYFLTDGTFVPKDSRCVKIRRRNPLNPRALDRAMGRLTSAKRAAKKLGRVTIRKKC